VQITATYDSNGLPAAGSQLRVEVTYRYNLVVVSGLLGMLQNPVTIDRTVLMEVQNN
jgi:hypothetical protein